MPEPISDDLRRRLLQAWAAGEGTLEELAQRFCVSVGFAKKARQQLLRTGKMERVPQARHGFPSRVDDAAREQLVAWIRDSRIEPWPSCSSG
jgi:transposase